MNDLQHIINLQMNSPQKHSTDSRSVRLIYLATRNDLLIFVKQNSSRKKYNPPTNPMGTACFQAPLGKSRTFLRKKLVRSVGFNIFNDNHELHVSKDTITQRKLQIIKTLGNPNTLNFRRYIWTSKFLAKRPSLGRNHDWILRVKEIVQIKPGKSPNTSGT